MESIDRLGWVDGFAVRPWGALIGVRSNQTWLLQKIREEVMLPSWEVEALSYNFLFSFLVGGERRPGFRDFHLLFDGSARIARSLDVEEVFETFRTYFHRRVAQASNIPSVRAIALGIEGRAELFVGGHPDRLCPGWRCGRPTLLAPDHAYLTPKGLVQPYLNRPLPVDLDLPLEVESLPLGRVWVAGQDDAELSPARIVWHLFSHMETCVEPGLRLKCLSAAVSHSGVTGMECNVYVGLPG